MMRTADPASVGLGRRGEAVGLGSLHQLTRVVLLVAAVALLAVPDAKAQALVLPVDPSVPQGVWLLEGRAAVQIFDCEGLACGRIVWLHAPRNLLGQLDRDKNNPNPALRGRELCGQTIIWGLRPDGPNRWKDGWFYNPDDGITYRFSAKLKSADVMVARIYVLIPLLGETKTLVLVSQDVSEGWCLAMQPPSSTPGGGAGPSKGP